MNARWPPIFVMMMASISQAVEPSFVREDVSIGFLPLGWVESQMRKVLSPQGKFEIVSGVARITDVPARIEAARQGLTALQGAPAIVQVELKFHDYHDADGASDGAADTVRGDGNSRSVALRSAADHRDPKRKRDRHPEHPAF